MIETHTEQTVARRLSRTIGDDRAAADGPTLIVIGGLHANEPAGIRAALRIHTAIASDRLRLAAGRFISLRGNLTALAARSDPPPRYIHEDLNRAFIGTTQPDACASAEQRERAELTSALDTIDAEAAHPVFLLDLHTVSSDSPPFVVFEDSLAARRFASAFPLPKMLGLEEELQGLLIDDATRRLGTTACIIEAGRHTDPRSTTIHEALVLISLDALRMTEPGRRTSTDEDPRAVAAHAAGPHADRCYDVRQRTEVRHESFEMLPSAAAFSRVRARRTVLATERGRPITADASGLLFMPNRQRTRLAGDDGFFIVQPVGRVWLGLSARLRRSELVHRLLPALLPGVRRRPGDPHTILVAPEYAAILRCEILHLLGYRLIRWHHTPSLTPRQRIVRGLGGLCRSVLGILRRAAAGGEPAALPIERNKDWIARRRRLDVDPPGVRARPDLKNEKENT
ncbi:MAG: succinylglutamate desuccinylase/aspartoacylase family protein [Planctomycetota bacterium]